MPAHPRALALFAAVLGVLLSACGAQQPGGAPASGEDAALVDSDAAFDAGPSAVDGGSPDAALPGADAALPGPDAGPDDTFDAGPCVLDGGSSGYHPAGWLDRACGFHGDAAKEDLAGCTGCHGAELTGGAASCDRCHAGWKTRCTFCHGGKDDALGSPPFDTQRRWLTTRVTVGAHRAHGQARISAPIDCDACHVKPADALATGHIDPAPAETKVTGWKRDTETCANTYCHGGFAGGATTNAPKWTRVDGTQGACGTCHGLSPRTGKHPSVYDDHAFMRRNCTHCHAGIADSTGTAILDPRLHVNGARNVVLRNGGTYSASTRTCYPSCHEGERW